MKRQNHERRITYRYSEAFKIKVVGEIESGRHTISTARRTYDIPGADTISYWIRKMGKLELLNKMVYIQMPKEKDKIKELNQQVKQLKEALVQTQLQQLRLGCDLEVAMEMLGFSDKEAFKKKLEEIQSKKQ